MSATQVRLRAITEADLPDYVEWLNDPEVTRFTQIESGGITLEGERAWFEHVTGPDSKTRNWAIEADGRHIGNCALMPDESGEMAGFGIIIGDKRQWSKGNGTAALREVLRIGFEEMGLQRIHLTAFAANGRAIRCYEKCGFRHEGVRRRHFLKRGKWEDIVCMGILREEWEARQVEHATANGGVSIRSYRPGDYPGFLRVWEACGFDVSPNDAEEVLAARCADPESFVLVAWAEGEVVATVMGHMDRRWGWIQRLAVHPDHRRNGLGRRLVQEAERRLAVLGAYRAVLMTSRETNPAAVALYEGLGYETWEPVIVMTRRLEDAEA